MIILPKTINIFVAVSFSLLPDFNDAKDVPVDLTWEINACREGECTFRYFANPKDGEFYYTKHHNLSEEDEDEIVYCLGYYKRDLVEKDLKVIKERRVQYLEIDSAKFDKTMGYTILGQKDGYYHIAVTIGKDIKLLFVSEDLINKKNVPESFFNLMTVENISEAINFNNSFLGDLENISIEREVYPRQDGTSVLIEKTGKRSRNGKVNEYIVYDVVEDEDGFPLLRKRVIFSESDLTNISEIERGMIAEELLSEERLSFAVRGLNGYIGYIENGRSRIDETFIKVELNVVEGVEVE